MRTEKQDFTRYIDNTAIDLDGREFFIEVEIEFTLCKTVYDGDWVTPDDWDIEIESYFINTLRLIDTDSETCMCIVTDGKKQDGYDHINPGKIVDDLIANDDGINGWLQDRATEIML